ncbi:Methylase involved in ubiquinone/menaquinone biosynthesis [Hyella patelloides LEGE 07179]|uniref:Methylase involved in ubiquinone/menaquinone biosynthesis n=1 Tax=Hyella patelloides LEGE 07179 TaxID=945734 RepID=A0A563VJ23_9CYAN|nr:class I SAM-dependent methyltransferase [Hyella patelloides]VEP11381.1 Methylase involved in ubiquinone/menaquinone biosynthesis [Hyella patelloides LEGE 07179]
MTANTDKLKPDWAGNDLLSRFVNLLIQIKPVYSLMKYQARQVLIKTAEKNGIPWRKNRQELAQSGVQELYNAIANLDVEYPDYYCVPFHAYDEGNLCWQAAFEAGSATQSMGLRVWKNEPGLTWEAAQNRLRSSFHQVLESYTPTPITDILDLGCSVGISTTTLHDYYSAKQVTPVNTVGLDLSPYMLAVATTRDTKNTIKWIHSNAEKTNFADNSFDLVTLQYVIHELPRYASQAIFREIKRILRPNGVIAIVDNNPSSTVIQNLPPVLFTLMKSTEPWSDDYYTFNVEKALQEIGFNYQTTVASDPRHRTIIATK